MTRAHAVAFSLALPLPAPAPAEAAQPASAAEKAAVEYQRGKEAFQAKHYEVARTAFERAYLLDPSPVLLFNLGRTCEEAGEAEKAIEYFQMYLDRTANAPDRGDVERRVRVMQAILSKRPPPGPEPVEDSPPPPPPGPASRTPVATAGPGATNPHTVLWPVGWATLGLGGVAVGAGVVFGLQVSSAEADHKKADTGAEKKKTADEAESASLKANVFYATGGVLLAAGATMLIIDSMREPGGVAPTVALGRDGALLGVVGAF